MRFLIQQKYFSIRDGFYIRDEAGREAYYVRGKLFTFGKQLSLSDTSGREILFIKQRPLRLLATFDIMQNGVSIARIKRKFPGLFLKRYKITSETLGDMKIKGNIVAWNFSILDGNNQQIATISKKILRIRDSYAVDVYDRRLEPFALGVSIILDAIHHRNH